MGFGRPEWRHSANVRLGKCTRGCLTDTERLLERLGQMRRSPPRQPPVCVFNLLVRLCKIPNTIAQKDHLHNFKNGSFTQLCRWSIPEVVKWSVFSIQMMYLHRYANNPTNLNYWICAYMCMCAHTHTYELSLLAEKTKRSKLAPKKGLTDLKKTRRSVLWYVCCATP